LIQGKERKVPQKTNGWGKKRNWKGWPYVPLKKGLWSEKINSDPRLDCVWKGAIREIKKKEGSRLLTREKKKEASWETKGGRRKTKQPMGAFFQDKASREFSMLKRRERVWKGARGEGSRTEEERLSLIEKKNRYLQTLPRGKNWGYTQGERGVSQRAAWSKKSNVRGRGRERRGGIGRTSYFHREER